MMSKLSPRTLMLALIGGAMVVASPCVFADTKDGSQEQTGDHREGGGEHHRDGHCRDRDGDRHHHDRGDCDGHHRDGDNDATQQ